MHVIRVQHSAATRSRDRDAGYSIKYIHPRRWSTADWRARATLPRTFGRFRARSAAIMPSRPLPKPPSPTFYRHGGPYHLGPTAEDYGTDPAGVIRDKESAGRCAVSCRWISVIFLEMHDRECSPSLHLCWGFFLIGLVLRSSLGRISATLKCDQLTDLKILDISMLQIFISDPWISFFKKSRGLVSYLKEQHFLFPWDVLYVYSLVKSTFRGK